LRAGSDGKGSSAVNAIAAILARMAEPIEQKLKLADAEVTLTRNVQLMDGAQQWGTADRMIIEHFLGNSDAMMIIVQDGQLRAKRLVPKIDFTVGPPPRSTTSRGYHDFADFKPEDEKRFLAIYRMFREA